MSGRGSTIGSAPQGIGRNHRRQAVRLLKAIGRGSGHLLENDAEHMDCQPGGKRVAAPPDLLMALISADVLTRRDDDALILTQAGRAWLRRALAESDAFRVQHQVRTHETRRDADDPASPPVTVLVDLTESPLAWLARRKRRNGAPWLSTAQLAAGERLRADFSRGGMMARITADWSGTAHNSRKRSGSAGGMAELTDAALAARTRVRAALERVGGDLSSVLIDVCCFLKGLETVEKQRGWPARSGKVILVIALEQLAAHYGLSEEARGAERSGRIQAAASAVSAS